MTIQFRDNIIVSNCAMELADNLTEIFHFDEDHAALLAGAIALYVNDMIRIRTLPVKDDDDDTELSCLHHNGFICERIPEEEDFCVQKCQFYHAPKS